MFKKIILNSQRKKNYQKKLQAAKTSKQTYKQKAKRKIQFFKQRKTETSIETDFTPCT